MHKCNLLKANVANCFQNNRALKTLKKKKKRTIICFFVLLLGTGSEGRRMGKAPLHYTFGFGVSY